MIVDSGLPAFKLDLTGSPADTEEVWNEVFTCLVELEDLLEELDIGTGLGRLPSGMCETSWMFVKLSVVRIRGPALRDLPATLFDDCKALTEVRVEAPALKGLPTLRFEGCEALSKVTPFSPFEEGTHPLRSLGRPPRGE